MVPNELHEIAGISVTTKCLASDANADYTELLVGLGRVGTDGGGWEGLKIAYTVDGQAYTLVVDHDMEICGTSVSCAIPNN